MVATKYTTNVVLNNTVVLTVYIYTYVYTVTENVSEILKFPIVENVHAINRKFGDFQPRKSMIFLMNALVYCCILSTHTDVL